MVWIPPIEWWWLGAGLWHWVYPIISHMSIYMQGCSKPLCLPRIPDTSAWSREVRAYVPRRKIKRVKPQVPRLDDWEMTGAPCCRRIEGSGIKSLYIFRGAEWTEHVAEYGLQPTYTYIYIYEEPVQLVHIFGSQNRTRKHCANKTKQWSNHKHDTPKWF